MSLFNRATTNSKGFATTVGYALLSSTLAMPPVEATEPTASGTMPQTERLSRKQAPSEGAKAPVDTTPYLKELRTSTVHPTVAQSLVESGCMKSNEHGLVLDQKHLMFVSWDAQGVVFNKSIFREPCRSHSALVAVRTEVTATLSSSGETVHTARQFSTVISFLPDSVDAIMSHVRVDAKALAQRDGVRGRNWQGLEFLFAPNSYIPSAPMSVSATRLIPISDALYDATIRQAALVDTAGRNYHVLSSALPNGRTENCISAISGILEQIPGGRRPLSTGPLRGQEATDYVAREILAHNQAERDATRDDWITQEFLTAVPAACSGVTWYSLRRN